MRGCPTRRVYVWGFWGWGGWMPKGLKRYYGQGHLHFLTFSCYRLLPLLGTGGWAGPGVIGVCVHGNHEENITAVLPGEV
jgi:hypothetical protein